MKTVVSISLGSDALDYDFTTDFLGQKFRVVRIGTNKDLKKAESLIKEWQTKADVLGLGRVREHYNVGTKRFVQKNTKHLEDLVKKIPVTTGSQLRNILHEWAIRHTQISQGNFFNNSRVMFFNGVSNYRAASVMSEFTDNLFFADPVMQLGVPKLLTSLSALELYATGTHPLNKWTPPHVLTPSVAPIKEWNKYILRKAAQKADVIAAGYEEVEHFTLEEMGGKTLLSSTITDERLEKLREKGVNMVVDICPKIFDITVGINVIEAMILAALDKKQGELNQDDFLEIMETLQVEPQILFPSGFKRINRFAFVIHPLSQQYFKNAKPLDVIAKYSPPVVMDTVEKVMAYAPPFVYSHVKGIKSPTGVEAEGWLITVGGTPKEIMAHSPEFTYRRLLAAAKLAKRMGAQIMGLGAFTKVVGDAGITVAKRAPLPITTGNSYSASGALWAAADATRRLGLVEINKTGKVHGKAMVVGATGAIGSVCARLLAKAVDEIYMVAPETAKLLAMKETILQETPEAKVHLSTHADKDLGEMDMIVTATSGAGKKILDFMKVKPGCVITDVARPLDIPASDVAKRPDVLVIESGEIELPGDVQMKNISLPNNVAYACLAETIVLALEGRFENFTLGRNIEWEKVKEIYQMGLKHGMKLAAISGVSGVYTDDDIKRIREFALKKRAEMKIDKPKVIPLKKKKASDTTKKTATK
ncbi:dehydrogenase [Litoribrevibacter albus]|uniref:Serine carboxypeptidase n=1 Tax=Litoribrevibacter albus TaxID=1473156 RepID=A0AA37W5P6_9GAMM|nr:dehydrogenase [Litoribrevibacter albus]GLQ29638.1 serine carboxypeptidase [Litoribrevibacter albus]